MADTPSSIFISYSHADSAFVDQLEASLRQQGFATWVDRQRLAGGQRWRRELQEAVGQAHVLLIVLSPDAIVSQNVQIEFDYALELGKLLIPVYYRQCNVPMELRAIQWIDFRHSYEQGLAALLQALRHQPESATPVASPAQSTSSPQTEPVSASPYVPGEAERKPPSNLPVQLTPLIGRQRERQAVGALLTQPEVRLVTLTGSAGIGKTRLAVQVAADFSEQFPDGVFLVALSPVSDPEQVIPAILQTLSISEMSGQTPLQRLKTVLHEKQLLLLLDNFEQVVQAAVAVAELLSACAGLKVLVTSRMVVHLRGEHEYVVPPLSLPNPKRLPDLATLAQYEAVALFLQRAQAVKPEFELTAANASAVASICIQLDGLPLAIELAAARTKHFAPQTLLARLEQGLSVLSGGARDLPARQQTLRGAIAWSYELLSPEEQQIFRRLSVFVNGCTLLAAEQVCTAPSPLQTDLLEGLLSLVDKSLLRQAEQVEGIAHEEGEPRFWMLQTLREFGLEMLDSGGEKQVTLQAHAAYYLEVAEQAEPHLRGVEQANWLARLEQEHENLRVALSWLLEQVRIGANTQEEQQRVEEALRLCVALSWFWIIRIRGYLREGLAFLQQALATGKEVAATVRARAFYAGAQLAFNLDDLEKTELFSTEALHLFRNLGDKGGIADSLVTLATAAWGRGKFSLARPQLEEAASLYEEMGERWKRGRCLTQLARIDTAQGEYDRAQALLEESLLLYRALRDKERLGWSLYLLARLLFLSERDLTQARNLTQQSLALLQEVESPWHKAYSLVLLGQIALQQAEQAQAHELFEEGLASLKEVGDQAGAVDALLGLARAATLQGDFVTARTLYQQTLIFSSEADYMEGIIPGLEGLAVVEAQQDEPQKAARLWGTAEALRERIGAPIPPVERADQERAIAAVCSQLGEQAFTAAWADGRARPLKQVIDDVLKLVDEVGKQ